MRWKACIWTLCVMLGFEAVAQEVSSPQVTQVAQTITLKVGWNAFWLGVAPEGVTASEVFEEWPTDSVSMYRTGEIGQTGTFTTGTGEALIPRQPFLIWLRGMEAESTLHRLQGDAVYVLKASEARTITLKGGPVGRRMEWHTEAYGANYFGVSVPEGVRVAPVDYLMGFGTLPSTIYRFGGTGDVPEAIPLLSSQKVTLGDVLVFGCQQPSDWSGTFQISPRYGIHLGQAGTTDSVTVRNDSGGVLELRMTHMGVDGVLPPNLNLWYRDPDYFVESDAWTQWTEPLTKTLEPGATWTLQIGLDRNVMGTNGRHLADTLVCTDLGRSRHMEIIPVSANDLSTRAGRWPDGIWSLAAELETVTRVVTKDDLQEGLKAHRKMPIRLILRIDGDGNMEMLQRFTAASLPEGDMGTKTVVYGPLATPDTAASVTARLSTPVMATDLPCVTMTGVFPEQASAEWTLAPTSTSNPFRHPYHPEHDGMRADFTTAAPDGDVMANYTQPVKPELWSVKNTITLQWDRHSAVEWMPVEILTGTLIWKMEGLRAEGPITVTGPFSMSRIIESPDYRKE